MKRKERDRDLFCCVDEGSISYSFKEKVNKNEKNDNRLKKEKE